MKTTFWLEDMAVWANCPSLKMEASTLPSTGPAGPSSVSSLFPIML